MLQFWKKSRKGGSPSHQETNRSVNGNSLPVGVFLPTLTDVISDGPLANFHHDGYTDTLPPQRSRLSVSLSEALHDKVARGYLAQYIELRGCALLLNMWQDLEELKMDTDSRTSASVSSDTVRVERTASSSSSTVTQYKLCQYLCDDVIQRYRLSEDLCTRLQSNVSNNITDHSLLLQLQDNVYQIIRREIWHDFLRSEFFSKLQVEVLTSGNVTLSDIVYHSAALTAFSEFLEQEGCQCVIEFWQSATNFQSQLRPDSDPIASQNDAIELYDKYLSLQATCPLGIDDATRCEVEQLICVEGAAPRPDCLEPALRKAWAYLRYVCLPLFLSSQSYVQLISELMKATRANSSPASSVTDVSIESSRSRFDPDLIWRRKNHNRGLTIGRIDQLGRFETDIEPEPDKKTESRISRVVKKLVNKDEHKAQEEMAWRVAEMIVKDVTNLTMGGQADDVDDT